MSIPKLARGYICARMRNGRSVPQHIQQQVIRDYCYKNGFHFLLSATEYVMDGSTLTLNAITENCIVMYSMYQFPRGWKTDKEIHFAAENFKYTPETDETFALMDLYERNDISATLAQLYKA